MTDLPLNQRPRERGIQEGVERLSTLELIAVTIGSGTQGKTALALAGELLSAYGSLEALKEASVAELAAFRGMGKVKAVQLRVAFCLGERASRAPSELGQPVQTAAEAYALVRQQLDLCGEEHFVVILRDARCRLLKLKLIAIGTLTEVLVHPREVFVAAVRHRAAGLIAAHNHPTGDPSPSPADIVLTRQLIGAGEVMGIGVDDHLIVGRERYLSLRQEMPHLWS